MSENRVSNHQIDPAILARWSPRAFDAGVLPLPDLKTLMEAARWAPSAFNLQPWRFIYALRGDHAWEAMLGLLLPFNQVWAAQASALVFVVSQAAAANADGVVEPSRSHAFDAGAAWGFLALQATRMGLATHAMTGFDAARASAVLVLPDNFEVQAAIAIGRTGDPALLSEKLRKRELPSDRRALADTMFHGTFGEASERT